MKTYTITDTNTGQSTTLQAEYEHEAVALWLQQAEHPETLTGLQVQGDNGTAFYQVGVQATLVRFEPRGIQKPLEDNDL